MTLISLLDPEDSEMVNRFPWPGSEVIRTSADADLLNRTLCREYCRNSEYVAAWRIAEFLATPARISSAEGADDTSTERRRHSANAFKDTRSFPQATFRTGVVWQALRIGYVHVRSTAPGEMNQGRRAAAFGNCFWPTSAVCFGPPSELTVLKLGRKAGLA